MSEDFSNLPGFARVDGELHCEGVSVRELTKRFGTPLYIYSHAALSHTVNDWREGIAGTPHRVFYAMKANSNLGILTFFARSGLGFDIVSAGELARAVAAGADSSRIVYSGVGKTVAEIRAALEANIECFNIESIPELDRVQEVAASVGKVAPISVRVNPNVDAKTHPYISTGLKNNKFGVAFECVLDLYRKAAALPNIRISGIDCHIGSQITELEPFVHAADKVLDLVEELRDNGIELDHIDFGGGLGVRYNDETPPAAKELVAAVSERCKARGFGNLALFFEPGRSLVARAGILATEVQFVKPTEVKNFCIVDAAMNDMIRPTLYEADMAIENCRATSEEAKQVWDVVGPVCETGDFLGKERSLDVRPGDILIMTGAGAYGMSMASNYNSRGRAAEVIVRGTEVHVVRERETVEDMLRKEKPFPA